MFKKVLGLTLLLIAIVVWIISCCDDSPKLNPVSEIPTDNTLCSDLRVDTSGTTTDLIGIYYTGDYSEISVLWGDSNKLETYPKTQSSEAIAYHQYKNTGVYNIKVTLYDRRGYPCDCSKWTNISDKNNPNPNTNIQFAIQATPSYGKSPLNVSFTYTFSATDNATCKEISWDFGDNSEGTGLGTIHTYTTNGSYNVTAVATDTMERQSYAYATISVSDGPAPDPGNQPPSATISADITTHDVKGTTTFTVTASDPDGTITNTQMVYGDGNSANGAPKTSYTHEYYNTAGGSHPAYVIVTDDKGQTAQSNTITITVKPNLRPEVKSELQGEPYATPDVNAGDILNIYLCGSTDPNVGDHITKYYYSTSSGLIPLSGQSTNCQFNVPTTGTGEKAVELHTEDSYGLGSLAQSRKFNVIAKPKCTVTGVDAQKIVINYSLSGSTCSPYISTSTFNGPADGATYGRGCPVTSGSRNFMTEGSGTYEIIWTMRVNATDCEAGDTVEVRTELTNICSGTDVNNDAYVPNVVPNQYKTYSIRVSGSCTNTNRRWGFKVNGNELYRNILDSVNAH